MTDYRKRLEAIDAFGEGYGNAVLIVYGHEPKGQFYADLRELLAESDRLRSLVEEAKGVVGPFASIDTSLRDHEPDETITVVHNVHLGDIRAARSLLDKLGGKP